MTASAYVLPAAASLGLGFSSETLYARREEVCVPAARAPAPADSPAACPSPWSSLLLDVEGNAFVCCVHKANGIVLGTRPRDSVDAIWNGRRARLVREAMFADAAPACCAGCYRTS